MCAKSSMEWTDATWNAVTGCSKVSPGCARCYAALPPILELDRQIGEFGRGERDSPSLTQRSVTLLLINRTPPQEATEQSA